MLGEKDAAIKEAERAITLLPSAKDAVDGPGSEENLAVVEAIVGDKNRAIPRLQHLLQIPYTTNQLLYQLSYAGKNAAHINAHRSLEQVACLRNVNAS